MRTYFIRHSNKKGIIEDTLLQEKRIGIFFNEQPWEIVFDSSKGSPRNEYFTPTYRNAKDSNANAYLLALQHFYKLSQEGGYVFVEYGNNSIGNNVAGCILGKVLPNTPIEAIKDICPVTLQLDKDSLQMLKYSEYPVLLAIRPPYVTICEPSRRTHSSIASLLIEGQQPNIDSDLLHPKMVEQMCVEYLRHFGFDYNGSHLSLDYCYLKPGKTLAIVDIAARASNGSKLFAQVKNGPINKTDRKRFIEFLGTDDIGIIFHHFDGDINKLSTNVIEISVNHIFEILKKHKPQMLKDMAGIEALKI